MSQTLKVSAIWKELVAKVHDCSPDPPGWRFRRADGEIHKLRKMGHAVPKPQCGK